MIPETMERCFMPINFRGYSKIVEPRHPQLKKLMVDGVAGNTRDIGHFIQDNLSIKEISVNAACLSRIIMSQTHAEVLKVIISSKKRAQAIRDRLLIHPQNL